MESLYTKFFPQMTQWDLEQKFIYLTQGNQSVAAVFLRQNIFPIVDSLKSG